MDMSPVTDIGDKMAKYDIWDIESKEGKDHESGKPLHRGQRVLVTRVVTYTYEVNISDVMDEWDEPGELGASALTVKEFITDEQDNNEDFRSEADEEDDVVISVEVLKTVNSNMPYTSVETV